MTKKLVWRLSKLPTVDELRGLVQDKIMTKEEAQEILFNQEEQVDRDKKSLESEIKFLRELVEKLSNKNNSTIVETIRYIEKPYYTHDWFKPYATWTGSITDASNVTNVVASGAGVMYLSDNTNFSKIETF